jgi:hypothetical protein
MEMSGQLRASAASPSEKASHVTIAGSASPESMWTLWRREETLATTGNRTPIPRLSSP